MSSQPAPPPPPLVDTHCHLAFSAFDEDRPEVLARAREAGLVGCVAVAVDAASADRARALADAEPGFVHATAGVHPTEELVADDRELDAVAERLATGRFVAVGETGLDDFHDSTPMERQRVALRRHIGMALEHDLPIILHCRDAFGPMAEELAKHRGDGLRGVLHCFTGEVADVEGLLAVGLHIGVGGIATYKPRGDLRAAVREVPTERLLVETDAPWLSPVPMRGRRNEPAFVAHVAEHLAADRDMPLEAFAEATTENARALFGI